MSDDKKGKFLATLSFALFIIAIIIDKGIMGNP